MVNFQGMIIEHVSLQVRVNKDLLYLALLICILS